MSRAVLLVEDRLDNRMIYGIVLEHARSPVVAGTGSAPTAGIAPSVPIHRPSNGRSGEGRRTVAVPAAQSAVTQMFQNRSG